MAADEAPRRASGPYEVRLEAPSPRHRESFLVAAAEFRREGLPWWIGGDLELAERDFDAFVDKRLSEATRVTGVPKTHRWALVGDTFVGRVAIHHTLDDALRASGGHIGYDTAPSWRGRGVASAMLRLALPLARELGLAEVLLTCDDDNAASIRVIEKNGGALRETRVIAAGRPPKRYYWITLG